MKIAIIYKTFLGTTKKYVVWLSEEFKGDMYTFNEISDNTLESYDLVVVASGTYASTMPFNKFLKKHWEKLATKKVIAIAVGMIPANDIQSQAQFELIPEHIQQGIYYFKLPGKLFKAGKAGEPSKEFLKPVIKKIFELQQTHLCGYR